MSGPPAHSVAAVVPVFQGERSLRTLVGELIAAAEPAVTPQGRPFELTEIILVHDCGPDASDRVIRELVEEFPIVRAVWLSRNFGQHAATMAGMASSTADWVATLDEDGQHNPADIPRMLDVALNERSPLVYARPTAGTPHSWFRDVTSTLAKFLANNLLISGGIGYYSSFRLMLGENARSLAAYSGPGTYLDAAAAWIVPRSVTCDVDLRDEARDSGYRLRGLFSHLWRLVLTSGTRPLRIVSVIGAISALFGVLFASFSLYAKFTSEVPIQGWTSVIVVSLLGFGLLLISLGVVAEYVGVGVRMAMGRPPYLVVSDPGAGPLSRTDSVTSRADQ
jgi:undecaprenyl-phosphate 4-deoxy-4-formamido-L-arabinose transferase